MTRCLHAKVAWTVTWIFIAVRTAVAAPTVIDNFEAGAFSLGPSMTSLTATQTGLGTNTFGGQRVVTINPSASSNDELSVNLTLTADDDAAFVKFDDSAGTTSSLSYVVFEYNLGGQDIVDGDQNAFEVTISQAYPGDAGSITMTNGCCSHTPGQNILKKGTFTFPFDSFSNNPDFTQVNGLSLSLTPQNWPAGWATPVKYKISDIRTVGPSGPSCDFNGDASCNVADIDDLFGQGNLLAGVSGSGSDYDLTGDGTLNGNDIAAWLAGAATENGHPSAYLAADKDLDRDVDLTDYNVLTANFSPAGSAGLFSTGDGDGDGDVDLSDYNTLASNFSPIGYGTTAEVPEPSSLVFCLLGLAEVTGVFIVRRR
jgi:hypothetical protein